jgi:arginine utilization protein RocB
MNDDHSSQLTYSEVAQANISTFEATYHRPHAARQLVIPGINYGFHEKINIMHISRYIHYRFTVKLKLIMYILHVN